MPGGSFCRARDGTSCRSLARRGLTLVPRATTVGHRLFTPRMRLIPIVLPVAVALIATRSPVATDVLVRVDCDSTALQRPVGTFADTLRLAAYGGSDARTLRAEWLDLFLSEVGTHLTLPRPLQMDVFGDVWRTAPSATKAPEPAFVSPRIGNELRITLGRDGHVGEIVALSRSLVPGIDAALAAAVRAADSTDLGPRPTGGRRTIFIALTSGASRVAAPSEADGGPSTTTESGFASVSVPPRAVAVLRVPVLRPATAAVIRAGTDGPHFPMTEGMASRHGRVEIDFIVDTTGRIAPGTLHVSRFATEAFARAAISWVAKAQFTPARIGGCPVLQRVTMPFDFQIGRDE